LDRKLSAFSVIHNSPRYRQAIAAKIRVANFLAQNYMTSLSRLVLPGGGGYLGGALSKYFAARDYEIIVLTRHVRRDEGCIRFVPWDARTLGAWTKYFEGAAAIINLAGRSVNCRYDAPHRREIYASRLDSTRIVGQAIAQCASPPPLWLNASSATIYRDERERDMDEATGVIGSGFSVDVCRRWEETFFGAATPQTRRVALRAAMVFGPGHEGAYAAFARLVKMGLGGAMAGGDQYVSWIHRDDFCRAVEWIMRHENLSGPINLAAPNPLRNAEFLRIIRKELSRPIGLPATKWMLEIGTRLMKTEAELVVKSRRVVPKVLLDSGFEFYHSTWPQAMHAITAAERG